MAREEPVIEETELEISPGKRKLLDYIFEQYQQHADAHGPELNLSDEQKDWLSILFASVMPEPGPAARGSVQLASIDELRTLGVILEANRQFFHPLGLALELVRHTLADGSTVTFLHGVWDSRDDPEGIAYSDDAEYWDAQAEKLLNFEQFRSERHTVRESALGYVVQPITTTPPEVV